MAGWRDYSEADLAKIGKGNGMDGAGLPPEPKGSKYRNVKVVVDGIKFDSKREAQHYHDLKLREKAGEIRDLTLQFSFDLLAPRAGPTTTLTQYVVVSTYIADFVYRERGSEALTVVDAKAWNAKTQKFITTAEYRLKKKWLFLQSGIEIQEV